MTQVLRDPIPPHVRREVMTRAQQSCEDCGEKVRLDLHHLRYRYSASRLPIFGHETANDLAALCRQCHNRRHIDPAGEYWRDPEEMQQHWASFYAQMDTD